MAASGVPSCVSSSCTAPLLQDIQTTDTHLDTDTHRTLASCHITLSPLEPDTHLGNVDPEEQRKTLILHFSPHLLLLLPLPPAAVMTGGAMYLLLILTPLPFHII